MSVTFILSTACATANDSLVTTRPVPFPPDTLPADSPFNHPFYPMFSLTPFPPTATPALRPIPPLPRDVSLPPIDPMPGWLASISPAPNSQVPLEEATAICMTPAQRFYYYDEDSPLLTLFHEGQHIRHHLFVEVNGIIPSELTWQNMIVPNSTHPGTAWVGTLMTETFCWPMEITTGLYEVVLHYPTQTGTAAFRWHFETTDTAD